MGNIDEEIKSLVDKILSTLNEEQKGDMLKELKKTYIQVKMLKEIAEELDL